MPGVALYTIALVDERLGAEHNDPGHTEASLDAEQL